MDLTLEIDRDSGVLKIAGNLDIDTANELREALLTAHKEVDLSEVTACDAAALQVLLAARKTSTTLVCPSLAITETAQALGITLTGLFPGASHAD